MSTVTWSGTRTRTRIPPTWYLQGKYFVHKAHFRFTPLVLKQGEVVLDSRQRNSLGLAWVSILPPGVAVKLVVIPGSRNLTMQGGLKDYYELNASDIKAIAHDPLASVVTLPL